MFNDDYVNDEQAEVPVLEEAFFYHTLTDFEAIVRERGIGEVLAALDDSVLYELYRHLDLDVD